MKPTDEHHVGFLEAREDVAARQPACLNDRVKGFSSQNDHQGRLHFRLRASRISLSRTTSSGVAAGAGGAVFLSLLICLTMRKTMNARMTKFKAMVMKFPYASTAPAFFASTSVVAVCPASGTK